MMPSRYRAFVRQPSAEIITTKHDEIAGHAPSFCFLPQSGVLSKQLPRSCGNHGDSASA